MNQSLPYQDQHAARTPPLLSHQHLNKVSQTLPGMKILSVTLGVIK